MNNPHVYPEYPINEVDFTNWANSLDGDYLIGEVCGGGTCPISHYIFVTTGQLIQTDGDYFFDAFGVNRTYVAPEWVRFFVYNFDCLSNFKVGEYVTVRRLRDICPSIIAWSN